MTQLVLEIPGWASLEVLPTEAMKRGEQTVHQCADCGSVLVRSVLKHLAARLGTCPSCGGSSWWSQTLPLAGIQSTDACATS